MKHALRVLGKNITKSAMGRFLGSEYSHLDDLDASNPVLKRKRVRRCRHPRLEELLNEWQLELEEQGLGTSGELLQARAVKLWRTVPEVRGGKDEEPVPEFGSSWLEGYKSRYGIRRRTFHGEAASVSVTEASMDQMSQLREEVAGVPVGNRYNMDETALLWRMAPSVSLATRNLPGVKKDKSRVTLVMTTNDTGDDRFPVWVIGKAKVPRALAGFQFQARGLVWRSNRTAWMTGAIMGQWLEAFYAHIAATKRDQKVILLLDNFSGHRAGVDLVPPPDNIAVRFLPPNTTSIWQPMDQGIIRSFKTFYRRSFMRWYGERVGPANFVKEVTLLHAMEWTFTAWNASVEATTIRNCWRKSTLLGSEEEITSDSEGVDVARTELRFLYDAAIDPNEYVIDFDDFVDGIESREPQAEKLSENEVLERVVEHWRAETAAGNIGEEGENELAPPEMMSLKTLLYHAEAFAEGAGQREFTQLAQLTAVHQLMETIRLEHIKSFRQSTLPEEWGRPNASADS